jgi:hypothetical protein
MAFYFGLDLGQTTDPTAGVVLESEGEGEARIYLIRHIEEFALGTPYPCIIDQVQGLLAKPPLHKHCTLVIDHTGVGRAIYDMFAEAKLSPIGITITAGKAWHRDSETQYVVAKELLVGIVQKFLQRERLRSSVRVKHSRLLQQELRNFRVKLTKSANEQYGPDVRESQHDDVVLATAVALWYAEHPCPPAREALPLYRRSRWADGGLSFPRKSGWHP